MKIYLSGPITGVRDYKMKFKQAEIKIRDANPDAIILSPAILPAGLTNREYMEIDLAMIRAADVVALLPDWETSTGARLEKLHCQYTGTITMELTNLIEKLRRADDGTL